MYTSLIRRCLAKDLELGLVKRMGSASLREACAPLSGLPSEDRVVFGNAIGERALEIRADMRYWDLVVLLNSLEFAEPILSELWLVMQGKLSKLAPKHLIDLYVVCHEASVMEDIEYRLIDFANSTMYIDEYVAILRVLARKPRSHSSLPEGLSLALLSNESLQSQVKYLHACEILGALEKLNFVSKKIDFFCVSKCKSELELMPIDEHWKTITSFSKLLFSSKKLEELCRKDLENREKKLDELSRPIEFLQFLRFNGLLTQSILLNACTWANNAVYRPATRTQAHRRLTIFEVALLADLCTMLNVSADSIEKAIRVTVESRGGTRIHLAKPKPTKYRRRRAYLRLPDGYGDDLPLRLHSEPSEHKKISNEAAFAPALRATSTKKGKQVPLWQSRSNGWFFRK